MLSAGLDIAARLTAQSQLQARLAREVPEAASAEVELDSFPFLLRLLLAGEVPHVRATVRDLRTDRLDYDRVSVDLADVKVSRAALVEDRQIDLQSVGQGRATADLTQTELTDALGLPVLLSPGRVGVRVRGRTVSVSVSVRDGVLVIGGLDLPVPRLRIPGIPLFSCDPSAEALDGLLRLSCGVDEVPEELLREARRRLPQQ